MILKTEIQEFRILEDGENVEGFFISYEPVEFKQKRLMAALLHTPKGVVAVIDENLGLQELIGRVPPSTYSRLTKVHSARLNSGAIFDKFSIEVDSQHSR